MSQTNEQLPAVRTIDKPKAFDLWNEFFRAKHGMPPGWKFSTVNCAEEVAPKGFAKCEGGFRSYGKNGKEMWKGRDKSGDATFFFKMSDLRAFEAERAISMGVCPGCWGQGRIQTCISVVAERNRFSLCPDCGGTGEPVGAAKIGAAT